MRFGRSERFDFIDLERARNEVGVFYGTRVLLYQSRQTKVRA